MLHNLYVGLRIAVGLGLDNHRLRTSWCMFWCIALLSTLISFSFDLAFSAPPRLFQLEAFMGEAFTLIGILLAAAIASLLLGAPLQLQLPIAFLNAYVWVQLLSYLIFWGPLASILERSFLVSQLSYYLHVLWYALVAIRVVIFLSPPLPLRRLMSAGLLTAVLVLPAWHIELPRFWEPDYQAIQEARRAHQNQPSLDPERILTHQWPILEQAWSSLIPSKPGQSDLYFLGFAGHGEQDVFMKEVNFSRQLFDSRFNTQQRSLALINNPGTVTETPLANGTNLEATLSYLDKLIQPEEDILFLFLTSHGSEDHRLSVTLPPLPLHDLSAATLGELLSKSQFTWKIILVSACYSGGFIEHLNSPNHLVITAARPDRTSFGCSDDADMTYFGHAYFAEALQRTNDFVEAFDLASQYVHQWETEAEFTPSEPQIYIGEAIKEKLKQSGRIKGEIRQTTAVKTGTAATPNEALAD